MMIRAECIICFFDNFLWSSVRRNNYYFKFTDIQAELAIKSFNRNLIYGLKHRQKIFSIYRDILSKNTNVFCVDKNDGKRTHASWLFTIISEEKDMIQKKLRERKIESNQVHFRNDKYSIFKKFVRGKTFPNMDYVEDKYLVLPNHHKITEKKAKYIAQTIDNLL